MVKRGIVLLWLCVMYPVWADESNSLGQDDTDQIQQQAIEDTLEKLDQANKAFAKNKAMEEQALREHAAAQAMPPPANPWENKENPWANQASPWATPSSPPALPQASTQATVPAPVTPVPSVAASNPASSSESAQPAPATSTQANIYAPGGQSSSSKNMYQ